MNRKIIGLVCCMLLISTILPISATVSKEKVVSENIGINGGYKSKLAINSPDGKQYRCIMFCYNHEYTINWISQIEELGFEKAWKSKIKELTLFLILPVTILYFGTNDFRERYLDLFLKLRYKDEFVNFLEDYDQENGNGMITYLWLKVTNKRPVDFKSQPDNSWIEESWILDDGSYIPNPEIWDEPFLWYVDLPT
jgi:hypothetical protein